MISNNTWARTLLFLCVTWYGSGSPLEMSAIEHQLQEDHQKLCRFSNHMKRYEVGVSDFSTFFQKGVDASLLFYEASASSLPIFDVPSFEKKILKASHLMHPLKKQSMPQGGLEDPFKALDDFSGKWFGKWKTMEVSHLWLPIRTCSLKLAKGYQLIGYQSCFTGDGFGWNYVVKKAENVVILGYVFHFDQNGQLAYENPHYGFLNGSEGLTWVSNDHLYYEFLCKKPACQLGKHYVITAVPYCTIQKPEFKNLTQAVYTTQNPKSDSNMLQKIN